MPGKVILVGAGPGDPGLITVKALNALKKAEVVVYDRLVGAGILELIPESAERINVGKAASRHPIPQDEINGILLGKALEGKMVVRLKGGDPFVFGRGGEELELLEKNGVSYEVVPGVTSAVAAAAYAGIPVTHRDFCSSLHVVTAHARENRPPGIDFKALAQAGGTMVFVMGVTALPYICQGLTGAGLSGETPAAMVQNGTLPTQRKVVSTLERLEEDARRAGIKSPALIIVGEVCRLSGSFNWFERLPLFGKHIVVTRPKDRAGTLSEKLRELGARVLEFPCIETRPVERVTELEAVMERLSGYEWVVFTSPAGVKAAMESLFSSGRDARAFGASKIAVVGPGTAEELKKYALTADFIPSTYCAESLGEELSQKASGPALILRAREGTPGLCEALDRADIAYDDVAVYETRYASERSEELARAIRAGEIDVVTFTSASTVRGFAGSLGGTDIRSVRGICIGEQTEREAKKHGINTSVAQKSTIDSLVEAVISRVSREG